MLLFHSLCGDTLPMGLFCQRLRLAVKEEEKIAIIGHADLIELEIKNSAIF